MGGQEDTRTRRRNEVEGLSADEQRYGADAEGMQVVGFSALARCQKPRVLKDTPDMLRRVLNVEEGQDPQRHPGHVRVQEGQGPQRPLEDLSKTRWPC